MTQAWHGLVTFSVFTVVSLITDYVLLPIRMGRPVKYAESDCLDALQRVSDYVGYDFSQSQYDDHRSDSEPTSRTIISKCGGWIAAKYKAGVGPGSVRYDKSVATTMEELGYDPEAYGHVYVINYWREKTKDIYKYVGCTTDLEKRLMAHKADNQLIEAPVDYEGKEHLVTTDSEYEFAGIDEVIPVEETARPMARLYAVEKRIMLEIALENDTVHVLGGK